MPKKDSETVAERLPHAGVNFARMHAEDARPWVEGGCSLIDYRKGNSRNFDPENLDKLDYLIYCFKQKGIYLQLDLFCYRGFLPDDGLDYPEDGDSLDSGYREYSAVLDKTMKRWGLLTDDQGLVGGKKLISDTGELEFDFVKGVFTINTPMLKAAAGNINGETALGSYVFTVENKKMTLSLLSLEGSLELRGGTGATAGATNETLTDVTSGAQLDATSEAQVHWEFPGGAPGGISARIPGGMQGDMPGDMPGDAAVYALNPDGSRMKRLGRISGDTFKMGGTGEPSGCGRVPHFSFSGEAAMYYEIVR